MNKFERILISLYMLLLIYLNLRNGIFFKNHWIVDLILTLIFTLFSIFIHKLAQNYTAYLYKDYNIKISGLLNIKPFAHISFSGIIPFIFFKYGWANSSLLERITFKSKSSNQRIIILLSGISINLIIGFIFALLIAPLEKISFLNISAVLLLFSKINIFYAIFSLLPLPPLDGWFILLSIFKFKINLKHIEFYGELLLITLFITGIFDKFIPLIGNYLINFFIL